MTTMETNHSTWDSLPPDWSYDRMKDVVDLRGDKVTVESEEENYLELEDLEAGRGRILSRRDTLSVESAVTQFSKGDVLFGKLRPYLEKYCQPGFDGFCTGEILAFFPRRIYGRYLFYHMGSDWLIQRCNALAYGAKMPRVNWPTQLALFDVPLPPLPEQKRIAAYLDASCAAIDRTVETKQKQLEALDALRKSIIQRAVTQGLNPKVEMKIVPMDGVGLVPDHWRVRQLRYVCQISYGITLQLESGKTAGVPILTVQNLDIHGDWNFDNQFCIDEELVDEDDILKHGDLLFNWRNGSARHVGKTAFFDLEGRYTHVSFLLRMRCSKDLSPFYLKSYLGALRMAGFFEGSKDKVNKTFNSTELNRLSVLVPPIDEQKEIAAVVQEKGAKIENVRKVIEDQITTLTAYRKSLIHECVTGKRRIFDSDVAKVEAHV